MLHTDGRVEALEGERPDLMLGVDPADLGDQPLERLCDAVIERLRPERLQDDIALVAIRLHPQG